MKTRTGWDVAARRSESTRSGAAMVYALLLLMVITMIGTALVRGVVAQHRQRLRDELHAQTVRLAEAGWNRARRSLARSPEYAGELWQLDEESLGPDRRAEVRIEITPSKNDLKVIATYPLGSPDLNRVTQTGTISPMAPVE